MSYSRHNISFGEPLQDVRLNDGTEALVSEQKMRHLIEEEYRKGFEAGQKALGEQLIEQRKQLLDLQNGLLKSLENALPQAATECERSLVLLALESARRVVFGMPVDSALVERTVITAIAELKDTAEYEVVLNPDDLFVLTEMQSGILPRAGSTKVRFTPDARISRGDCVINTRHGAIAADRAQLFQKIETAVLC